MIELIQAMRAAPVIPVVTLPSADLAEPLAAALIAGGHTVVEVTLRSEAGFESIVQMKRAFPRLKVAAGTITTPDELEAAMGAGADVIFTPGLTATLRRALADSGAKAVPGVATASEAMECLDAGFDVLKFFPAEALGGAAAIAALGGPLKTARFIPTGGIKPEMVARYLGLRNVLAVGGSWIAPEKLIAAEAWDEITTLSKTALANVTP
jgi:2-dehydro-3-deoxyphosphogluconate aldolase/(4S)-4-hydroxy-2-oxoglutarate aldolase